MSKVIKSFQAKREDEQFVVGLSHAFVQVQRNDTEVIENAEAVAQTIIDEAHSKASMIMFEAYEKLKMVKDEIEQLRAQWQEDEQYLKQQAYDEGYSAGYGEGVVQAEAQYADYLTQAQRLLQTTKADYEQTIERSEEAILHISLKVAEKVLATALRQDEQYFLPVLRKVIKECREHEHIELTVHPNQHQLVHQLKNELEVLLGRGKRLFLFVDDTIPPFSCIIQSSFGKIDASIDSQLAEVRAKLFEQLGEGE